MKMKKGPWTREEDHKLLVYIAEHGHGNWRLMPPKAGLERCGKSCRLRWTNYLRPDIKRGKLSPHEEKSIIRLHALLGNKWSAIAAHLPKRTDNEIKNYWNTRLKKRLTRMGIDPVTHKPKASSVGGSTHSKNAANLSHMAQWETARLEAEARLVRESKFMSTLHRLRKTATLPRFEPPRLPSKVEVPYLDVIKIWQSAPSWGAASKATKDLSATDDATPKPFSRSTAGSLESPTSTLNFPAPAKFINSGSPEIFESITGAAAACEVASVGNYYVKEKHHDTDVHGNSFDQHSDYYYSLSGLSDLATGDYFPDGFNDINDEVGNVNYYWNDFLNLVNSPAPAGSDQMIF